MQECSNHHEQAVGLSTPNNRLELDYPNSSLDRCCEHRSASSDDWVCVVVVLVGPLLALRSMVENHEQLSRTTPTTTMLPDTASSKDNPPTELLRENSFEAQPHLAESRSIHRFRDRLAKPIQYASPLHNSSSQQRFSFAREPSPEYSSTTSSEDSAYRADVQNNRLEYDGSSFDEMEDLFEDRGFRGSDQVVLRHFAQSSPFANIGKSSSERVSRSAFFPSAPRDKGRRTYLCPRCGTRQREFFTVMNVSGNLEGPGSYLALYFVIYVMCSLFIFGLEEGWLPLDCIYFAVITLTTAGLGDFVPTSGTNKIICSVFIYFGVACIGLLLGSYIAGMLDDKAHKESKQKQMESCPNCARLKLYRESVIREERRSLYTTLRSNSMRKQSVDETSRGRAENVGATTPTASPTNEARTGVSVSPIYQKLSFSERTPKQAQSAPRPSYSHLLGSPVTRQILGRQSHTRHISFDVGSKNFAALPLTQEDVPKTSSANPQFRNVQNVRRPSALEPTARPREADDGSDYTTSDSEDSSLLSTSTYSSAEVVWNDKKGEIQNAKYVFLTLRKALVNSMVIIAVGCVGFWLIEGFSLVDSWYFTTVLLTTVGYGDIVPTTKGGKLFATIYILVAGTVLLNNMSTISMIPLELRRRRIEKAVLTQFGDHLDDEALRELATGPLVQRLKLTTSRSDGLDECTREMFSLAMLVRLGKVTEQDIKETFTAFRHLDVNDEGVLNSKSIIGGMIKQHRTTRQKEPPPPPSHNFHLEGRRFWYGDESPDVSDYRNASRTAPRQPRTEYFTENSPLVP